MKIYSKLKHYYRYLRNWKKFKSKQKKIESNNGLTEQLNFYAKFIKKGDLVFDIGANVGDKTDMFLHLGAKVIAVEPQESCWRVIKRRFKDKDINLITNAVSSKYGTVTMFLDRSSTISSISTEWIEAVKKSGRFSSHKWSEKIEVKTTTLDALVDKYGKPAFCKIDVEGAELDVLKSLTEPLNVISFEFVREQLEPSIKSIDYLSTLGNAQFNYHIGEATSFALANWIEANDMKNLLTNMDDSIDNFGDIYVRFENTGK